MFDSVRNNKRIVQIFLALITLPFALWGVESYFGGGAGSDDLAKVGDSKIGRQEFSQAMREQQERLRAQFGSEFNAAMLATPEARQALLDSLINRRLLLLHALKSGVTASDEQLHEVISAIPDLQEDGSFSMRRYERVLAAQGLSKEGFEAKLRQDLALQQLAQSVSATAIVSAASATRLAAIQLEERTASEALLRPEQFAARVKVAPEAVKAYYEANRALFEIPQQIRAEYVVLSRDALAEQVTISPEEVKAAYERNAKNYATSEERRASHILVQLPADAPEAAQKAARARIETIFQQAKKNPADFARLAREHSEDPGSAQKGGDLGFFTRGAMVKPFEDAVFGLQENQLSDIVRSDFGFHIIRLTGIRPGKVTPLEEVRGTILVELRRQEAARKFAEAAETFANIVYEQPDSLQPVAEKFKLAIQHTGLFDQKNRAAAGLLGGNEKLLSALFSEDALKNRRNTDAVEVAPNTLVAARVIEVRRAELRPFDAVKEAIGKRLEAEEAAGLARKEGEDKLARLRRGEQLPLAWSPAQAVSRQPMKNLSVESQQAIFKAATDKLPAYAGVQLPNGAYALYRISEVRPGTAGSGAAERTQALRGQLLQLAGAEDINGFLALLRQREGVKVDSAALAKGDNF
ncbi:MAG TPA: SurA N-terminal domain-containing protein [Candidatus Desulfobacillus sp.]|nr:SurA N-terminal domain-containing protein [Candidatus Desulfobacillus sp.]